MNMTKIRIDNLINPTIVDRDTVKATLNVTGRPIVTFMRKLKGWTPYLEIVISDGTHSTVVHYTDALSEERDAFNALMAKAQALADQETDAARRILQEAAITKIFKSVKV